MSEWLKIVLDEIARKTREAEQVRAERERQAASPEDSGAKASDAQAEGK